MVCCPICGGSTGRAFYPCENCRTKMFNVSCKEGAICSFCGNDLAGSYNPCTECRESAAAGMAGAASGKESSDYGRANADSGRASAAFEPLDAVFALTPWAGPMREWVSMLKYGGDARLAKFPAEVLADKVLSLWPGTPVVPVPPRFVRIFRDGFDPVGEIARQMQLRGVKVEHLLRRKGHKTQKHSSREQRLSAENLNFELKKKTLVISGPRIILDDVSTTGTTIRVCASLLRAAGCSKVYGITICKD